MKLLFIPEDKYPPFRVDVSILFGKELIKKHNIDWVMQSEKNMNGSLVIKENNCHYYVGPTDNGESFSSRFKKNLCRYLHQLKSISLLKKNYDIIIVKDQFFIYPAMYLYKFLTSNNFKLVFWLSYPFPESDLYDVKNKTARYPIIYLVRGIFLKLLLYKFIVPFGAHIFVQSKKMKKDILANYKNTKKFKNKITPVPMGIEKDTIPYLGYSTKAKNKEGLIVYLGTLIRIRKLDFLIRVLKELTVNGYNAKLVFIGDGEDPQDKETLINEAKRLNVLNRIEITGFLKQKDAWERIRNADVCLSPFYPTPILNSTSPTKIIEYMALGKAIVANNHPEQKTLIEESKCGLCVEYDVSEFATAIKRILDDEKMKMEMGIKGRNFALAHRSYTHIAQIVDNKLFEISKE